MKIHRNFNRLFEICEEFSRFHSFQRIWSRGIARNGKTIFDNQDFTSIKVVKGGAREGDIHAVDGISGGTITSDGVTDMLFDRLNMYLPYINKLKLEFEEEKNIANMDSVLMLNDSLIEYDYE